MSTANRTYNLLPHYRKAEIEKKAALEAKKAPYKAFAKEKLAQYNVGLISADDYYKALEDARLLMA